MFRKLFLVLSSALIFTACTPQGATPKRTTEQIQTQEGTIVIQNFKFFPDTFTASPGQVITVVNKDSAPHTVTSTDKKSFDSGTLGQDQSVTITAPVTPGSFPFICTIHPSMTGTLVVK